MAKVSYPHFESGLSFHEPAIVSDKNGNLWWVEPRTNSVMPARFLFEEEKANIGALAGAPLAPQEVRDVRWQQR